jgi:hypothetical protein
MIVSEAQKETDFDSVKTAFQSISLSDIRPIILSSIHMLQDVGEFSEASGNMEKKSKKAYDFMTRLGEQPEALLVQFIDKIPDDKLKPLIAYSLKIASLQEQLKDFKNVPAERKITLGKELKEVANKLAKLVEDISQ